MKDVLLKLSDEDYNKLKWVAEKLGMGVNTTLRSLIPNIKPRPARLIDERAISTAGSHDLVPVTTSLNKDKLEDLLTDLTKKKWALTLAREIKQQVLDKEGNYLTVGTYKRLSRWVHPQRQTEREKYVQPIAETISRLLFGRVIKRC